MDIGVGMVGIYELDGDTLKICWRERSGGRPTEFAAADDPETCLGTFERVKEETAEEPAKNE